VSYSYQDPLMSHEEATALLTSRVDTDIAAALISIGLNEQDEAWAKTTCMEYLGKESETIVTAAVCAMGHLARRQCELDVEALNSSLGKVKEKFPGLSGIVDDTLDDIELYT